MVVQGGEGGEVFVCSLKGAEPKSLHSSFVIHDTIFINII